MLPRTRRHVERTTRTGSWAITTTKHSSLPSTAPCLPVWVTGEIDVATAARLRRALERAIPDSDGRVVVDLAGVTFMDCSGLGPLLEAEARLGGQLSLRGVPPKVRDLLHLAGLQARFTIDDDAVGTTGPTGRTRELAPETGSGVAVGEPSQGALSVGEPSGNALSGLLELEEKAAGQGARVVSGRALIDQARGLVMATHGCDAEQAWQMLFRASSAKNVQVHELAEALAEAAAGRDMDQSSVAMRAAVLAVMAPAEAIERT